MIDYELIKSKKHPKFQFVSDFYKFHGTNSQAFLKYYHRYLSHPVEDSLAFPGKEVRDGS